MSIKQLKPYLKNLADEIRIWSRTTEKINAQEFPLWMSVLYTTGNDDGYQSGYTSGYDEGEEIGYTIGFNEGHDWGYDAGKQAEYDRFWNIHQKKGIVGPHLYAFAGEGWTDATYNPKYPIKANNANGLFYYNKFITDTKVDIDVSGAGANSTLMFAYCYELHTIRRLKVAYNTNMSNSFTSCNKLVNITIDGVIERNCDMRWCPLSKESIESICNALSDNPTNCTLTLNKAAVNNAFSINVDDESTYPEGSEFYTLRHSKDNWTFSYV